MFARNAGWSLAGAVVGAPAALAVSVLLARWLEPSVNGQVQAGWSLLMLLAVAGQLGAVAAAIHRIRRARQAPGLALTTGLLSVTVTGSVVVAGLWAVREWLRSAVLLGLPEPALGWLLAAVVPLLWMQVFGGVSRALDRFPLWAVAQGGAHLARLVGLAAAVVAATPAAWAATAALAAAQGVTTLALGARVLAHTGLAWPQRSELWMSTRYGAQTYLFTMAGQVHERVDLFLLAALHGDAAAVATYAVAVGVVNRIRVIPIAMASALFPRAAELDDAAGARFTAAVCRHAILWTGLAAALLGGVAVWVVPAVWGSAYAPSVQPMWVLLPATVALSVSSMLGRYFQAVDRQPVIIGSQALGVVLNLALNVWWIPTYGAVGAAMASLVSYGVQGAVLVGAFVRYSGLSLRHTLVIGPDDLRWYADRVRRAP